MKKDKILHCIVGTVISFFIAVPVYVDTYKLGISIIVSILVAVFSGIIKEFCDYIYTKSYSVYDCIATGLGGIITIIFILAMHFGKG